MDLEEFIGLESSEITYEIGCTFPPKPPSHLLDIVDYRIKLMLKEATSIRGRESKSVFTTCKLSHDLPSFTMFLKGNEELPLLIDSQIFIPHNQRGKYISLNLTNTSNQIVRLPAGIITLMLINLWIQECD